MKIEIIQRNKMTLTGSKVLKLIQDENTPPVDLFVREILQNCGDACLENKDFVRIHFQIGKFKNLKLYYKLDGISESLYSRYNNRDADFIAISDTNTVGLTGSHKYTPNKDNNLYNLVYDIMNAKSGEYKGGSWGIGKSVYYRYGAGLCFYYSRCYEDGKYVSKLAGVLIEKEDNNNCLLGKNKSGIAFFGDLINKETCPITDENEIRQFLEIFDLKPYDKDKTGTIVIIPYFKTSQFLSSYKRVDEEKPYWVNNIEECLEASIKRWYFPRINNLKFNGKYFEIFINNKKIVLDHFYQIMQDLYNGNGNWIKKEQIKKKNFKGQELGTFNYAILSKSELGIHTPPLNYPDLNIILDCERDCSTKGLITYVRKPGMIITYDDNKFGEYEQIPTGKYLLGIFKLNDELIVEGENLGQYIRKTEKANHGCWQDLTTDDTFKFFISEKPYKIISSKIYKILKSALNNNKVVSIEGTSTLYQKRLAKLLLPPKGYGTGPSVNPPPTPPGPIKKSIKPKLSFIGFTPQGYIEYLIKAQITSKHKLSFNINVKAGSNTFSMNEWILSGFSSPFKIEKIILDKLLYSYSEKSYDDLLALCNLKSITAKDDQHSEVFKFSKIIVSDNFIGGFEFLNLYREDLLVEFKILIKPLDIKYTIDAKVDYKEVQDE